MAVNALQQAKQAAAKQQVNNQYQAGLNVAQSAYPSTPAPQNPLVNAFAQALHTLSQHIAAAPKQVQQALSQHPFIQTLGEAGLHLTPIGLVPGEAVGAAVGGAMGHALQTTPLKVKAGTPNANGVGKNYGISAGQNNIGVYTEPGLASFGGSVNPGMGLPQVGGTIGVDQGHPYGSVNVNHNIVGQFGGQPQNVYNNANWDVTKLQPGQALHFEDGSSVIKTPGGQLFKQLPTTGASVLGAKTVATRQAPSRNAPRPPVAGKIAGAQPLPYAEWKNSRGYDVLYQKGML